MATTDQSTDFDAIIVGAGFSGLYMLYKMRDELGMRAHVFEAGDGVGGTWYWNRYPGARCDSESYYYSFSFSSELEQEWEWSSKYPEQPEILRYLNHVADRFDLRDDISLSTRITGASFDDATDTWTITTEGGDTYTSRFFITAVGCLSTANVPNFPGLDSFQGDWYHTGAWPHEGVDFTGKRVGLIGTGSTGIQATPVIAAQAAHLTVFQRTPNYTIPARNAPLTPERAAEIKANYGEIRDLARNSFGGFPYPRSERSAKDVDEAERTQIYEDLWNEGGFKFLYGSFGDLMIDEESNETAAEFIRSKIREIVKDPATAELLCPTDHPYGSKRPPIDTNYFETFNRDNVTLVDVKSDPIQEITPTGLRTGTASYDLDVIVFATGFDAMTGSLLRLNISGSNGVRLEDKWQEGPRSYLGLQVAGFPNMFTITGPGSPSVLSNMPVSIEQHVDWIAGCIEHMRSAGLTRVEATEEAQEEWVEHAATIAKFTLFDKANSWYLGANIPGKTRVFMPYVGGVVTYRDRCNEIAANGYEGFAFSGNEPASV